MDHRTNHEKKTAGQFIALFIQKNSKILIGIIITVIVVLAGFGVYNQIRKASITREILAIEDLQDQYDEWISMEEESAKAEKESAILASIDEVTARYGGSYGGSQAFFLKGKIHFTLEEWIKAAEAFSAIYANEPGSYLASVGLVNAGVAYENGEDMEAAVSVYTTLADELAYESGFKSHALLSLGRLAEFNQDNDSALSYYNRLIDEYPNSSWTNTAINRIIYLQSGIE